jgi:hypothetical protein
VPKVVEGSKEKKECGEVADWKQGRSNKEVETNDEWKEEEKIFETKKSDLSKRDPRPCTEL